MVASGLREQGPSSCSSPTVPPTQPPDEVDEELLRHALPRLVRTWEYWATAPKAVLVAQAAGGDQGGGPGAGKHLLSRYHADWDRPRPESFRQESAQGPEPRHAVCARRCCTNACVQRAPPAPTRTPARREDLELAASRHDLTHPQGVAAARRLWAELASAAESGWDFSSRWCPDGAAGDLATTRTTQVGAVLRSRGGCWCRHAAPPALSSAASALPHPT